MNMPLTEDDLRQLCFDNRFIREIPGDPDLSNSRRQVYGAGYSLVDPTPVAAPQLVAYAPEVAAMLDVAPEHMESPLLTAVLSGNARLPGMEPYAMCYGGHQFGNWAGQLGDGRAINLGEVKTSRSGHQTLQLKGAGPTPYSRTADGLAVLRSSVREFLCSEAMHHLGIPTTRALSLVVTGELVERDMFYDGHPKDEPGAVVCRVAPSFLRFGTFELPASRGELNLLRTLADFTIRSDFPHLGPPSEHTYSRWLAEVSTATAALMVHWMRVGFVHGVMNTDNMSILGLTIDYGPYGWLEDYAPGWTPNTTDAAGRRYCFGRQPHIAQWNLLQLANSLYPLIRDVDAVKESLDTYRQVYQQQWAAMMLAKLGLTALDIDRDGRLVSELLAILELEETDYTLFFRLLADFDPDAEVEDDRQRIAFLEGSMYRPDALSREYVQGLGGWLLNYGERLRSEGMPAGRSERMNRVNPKYVLRNYLAQLAIDKAEQGDYTMIRELLELLRHPYDEQPGKEEYAVKRPEWARNRPGCSMLSCSS